MMTSKKLALTAAAVIAIGLAGVPQVRLIGNQLEQQNDVVNGLRVEFEVLKDAYMDLEQAHTDLQQEYSGLQTDQETLNSSNKKAYAEQSQLRTEYRALREEQANLHKVQQEIRAYHATLLASQESLSQEQQQFMKNFESNLAELVNQDQKIQAELGNVSGMGQAIKKDLQLEMAGWATDRRKDRLHELETQVLSPVFQLSGGEAVGSAVLMHREDTAEGTRYYALSCYHVIRDILEERADKEDLTQEEVAAVFTHADGIEVDATARMIAWDIPTDLALLELTSDYDLRNVARLAPRNRNQELGVFANIYTVGCPLGTAAQATSGEITRTAWEVDGEDYWMVSSPAYFGNSGGGVFHADTLELVGIFAKIYTHGSYRPQVITHMGLAIPIDTIHDWLSDAGYDRLLAQD
jgi:S1-C subfamily serine protease